MSVYLNLGLSGDAETVAFSLADVGKTLRERGGAVLFDWIPVGRESCALILKSRIPLVKSYGNSYLRQRGVI